MISFLSSSSSSSSMTPHRPQPAAFLAALSLLLLQLDKVSASALPFPQPGANGMRLYPTPTTCLDLRQYGAVPDTSVGREQSHWQENTKAFTTAAADAAIGKGDGVICVKGGYYTVADVYAQSHTVLDLGKDSGLLTSVTNATGALLHVENVVNFTVQVRGRKREREWGGEK
jgi:hypothetical protein